MKETHFDIVHHIKRPTTKYPNTYPKGISKTFYSVKEENGDMY
jgi:hypothetical protein